MNTTAHAKIIHALAAAKARAESQAKAGAESAKLRARAASRKEEIDKYISESFGETNALIAGSCELIKPGRRSSTNEVLLKREFDFLAATCVFEVSAEGKVTATLSSLTVSQPALEANIMTVSPHFFEDAFAALVELGTAAD